MTTYVHRTPRGAFFSLSLARELKPSLACCVGFGSNVHRNDSTRCLQSARFAPFDPTLPLPPLAPLSLTRARLAQGRPPSRDFRLPVTRVVVLSRGSRVPTRSREKRRRATGSQGASPTIVFSESEPGSAGRSKGDLCRPWRESREPDGAAERVDRVLQMLAGARRGGRGRDRSADFFFRIRREAGERSAEGVERDGEVEGSKDGRVGRGGQVEKDHGLKLLGDYAL